MATLVISYARLHSIMEGRHNDPLIQAVWPAPHARHNPALGGLVPLCFSAGAGVYRLGFVDGRLRLEEKRIRTQLVEDWVIAR
jgi:hypothetical protein